MQVSRCTNRFCSCMRLYSILFFFQLICMLAHSSTTFGRQPEFQKSTNDLAVSRFFVISFTSLLLQKQRTYTHKLVQTRTTSPDYGGLRRGSDVVAIRHLHASATTSARAEMPKGRVSSPVMVANSIGFKVATMHGGSRRMRWAV